MRIEAVTAAMPYEKDPYAPFKYEAGTISALEQTIGAPFPDDFHWYLAHVGWRKIDYDHRTILIRRGDYLHDLKFEAADNEVFALGNYRDFIAGKEGALLPGDLARYFPFGQIGGGNPHMSLRLLVSLNDDDRGSIWCVRPIGHFGDQTPSEPLRIAGDMAAFLEQIGPDRKLRPVAEENNEALFLRLLGDYPTSTDIRPTVATDAQTLITRFFEHPGEMIFDGARNVEYQYRTYGHGIENEAEFAEKAAWYAMELPTNPYHAPPPLKRREIKFGAAQVFDGNARFRKKHGYRVVTVTSLVGDNHKLVEDYLLHDDKGGWTLLRRHGATMADVKIKGIGTFAFDATYRWKLKKKVTPAWSEVPFDLHVSGNEDALTAARTAFVKDIIGNAALQPVFEAHVYRLYTEIFYPEFEAMPEDEKAEWADCYPRIESESEIWTLLGKKRAIHVESDDRFHLAIDACWDPEHGLTVTVEHGHIV